MATNNCDKCKKILIENVSGFYNIDNLFTLCPSCFEVHVESATQFLDIFQYRENNNIETKYLHNYNRLCCNLLIKDGSSNTITLSKIKNIKEDIDLNKYTGKTKILANVFKEFFPTLSENRSLYLEYCSFISEKHNFV